MTHNLVFDRSGAALCAAAVPSAAYVAFLTVEGAYCGPGMALFTGIFFGMAAVPAVGIAAAAGALAPSLLRGDPARTRRVWRIACAVAAVAAVAATVSWACAALATPYACRIDL